jgi:hypothetical protein
MTKQFDLVAFQARFNVALNDLRGAEKITRSTLMELSRSVLQVVHETQDIGYANRILEVLTPVNKKVAIAFFREFTGFKFSEKDSIFFKKDKKNYEEVKAKALEWLDDPLNNIWSWADRNIEVETKEFDAARLQKQAESLLKKAENNGFKKKDVLAAIMASGVTVDELVEFMQTLPDVELNVA